MLNSLINFLEKKGFPPGGRAPATSGPQSLAASWPAPVRKPDGLILTSAVWRNAYGSPQVTTAPAALSANQLAPRSLDPSAPGRADQARTQPAGGQTRSC